MRRLAVGQGTGPGILLVHGNDLCGEFYLPLARELESRGIRSVLVTLPGFAGEPGGMTTWAEYTSLLRDEIANGFPDGCILVGHSLGGVFAFLTAALCPRGLRGLVLMEPPLFPTRRTAIRGAEKYNRDTVFADRSAFQNWSGAMWRVADMSRFPASAIATYLMARQGTDATLVGRLFASLPALYPLPYASVQVPVLILRGARSGWRMRVILTLLRRKFANAASLTIPACGHFMANEADAALAEAIASFGDTLRFRTS